MNFEKSFAALIDSEGAFTDDPRDPGNWTSGVVGVGILKGTKFGISAASYPELDIKNLTLPLAKQIYFNDFWMKISIDKLPASIAFDMFDTAVNSGKEAAAKILQRALGLNDDGDIGPKTIAGAAGLDPQLLDKRFSAQRLLYITDAKKFPTYGRGWVRRIANNLLKD